MTKSLEFLGRVARGCGRFASEIVIPGRAQLGDVAPPDWPQELYPGTLNIKVAEGGWPGGMDASRRITQFDDGSLLTPALVIPQHLIGNNTLSPRGALDPNRGTGQAWRAQVRRDGGPSVSCWMFRRIGSGYRDVIELVSSPALPLVEHNAIVLKVFSAAQELGGEPG